jgi:hypothetical protein
VGLRTDSEGGRAHFTLGHNSIVRLLNSDIALEFAHSRLTSIKMYENAIIVAESCCGDIRICIASSEYSVLQRS